MMTAQELADLLGLKPYNNSWRGDCPACNYEGTFSISKGRNGRPFLWCASCQNYPRICAAIERYVSGDIVIVPRCDVREQQQNVHRTTPATAMRLWRTSGPVSGTPAEAYLTSRGIPRLVSSAALRFCPDVSHPEGGRYPAMVALISDADGQPAAVHRTYLRPDGTGKANVVPAKASLGPTWGGAIRLQDIRKGRPLVIGEGIETSASAGEILGYPAWAAVSAGNLESGLVLPWYAKSIVIASDADDAGRKAARGAWARWRAEGREVSIATPNDDGVDFNDLSRSGTIRHD
jgi:phage/plasmid primase-like uncharacterized protein